MSQSHEPSYYEIALTNRQVLVVFVVLLVCVVAAFFSGVWIGRQGDGPSAAQVAEVDSNDAAVGENEAAEPLNFFSDETIDETPSLSEVAEEAKAETTLAEDVGVVEASEGDGSEPSPAVVDEPSAPTQEVVREPVGAVDTGSTESVSEPQAETFEVQMAEGDHVIQVFSSADESQAKKLISQLTGGGFPAFLSPVEVGGQTMYRVRIGPYSELSEAETVAAKVRRSFKLDTWVTR